MDSATPSHPFTISYPENLPISQRASELAEAIRHHQVIIVAGETGSGKTTQLPKICLQAGLGQRGKIGATQPRRLAALAVSQRISEELGTVWGNEVGCKIRFDDRTRKETIIKVMTDGILLSEIRGDPNLKNYEAIIVDEAHERSLNIDFLLGYLRRLLPRRPDLKVIITSATIDTKLFSEAFSNAPVFEVSGRLFPVTLRYAPFDEHLDEGGEKTYIDAAVEAVEEVIAGSGAGDILLFLPSDRDIREAREKLQGRYQKTAEIIPLIGRLSGREQERVFRSYPRRKIIVSTNIAETSLTIPGIRFVIDSGLARVSRYSTRTHTKRLPIEPISQSSANQRMGRAGRVEAGECIRLYSEENFNERSVYSEPEIKRSNLAEVILRMKAFHFGEIEDFPFLESPDFASVRAGYTLLQELGALDKERKLTSIGRDVARLPIDPTIARMLLESRKEHCLSEMLVISSGLSIQDPRERPLEKREQADQVHRSFNHPSSDFLTLLNIWNRYHGEWEAFRTQGQLRRFCRQHYLSFSRMREWVDLHEELRRAVERLRSHNAPASPDNSLDASGITLYDGRYRAIHRCILAGLLGQIGCRIGKNRYKVSGGREAVLIPGSSLRVRKRALEDELPTGKRRDPSRERWVVAGEIMETARLFVRTAAPVDPRWIEEMGKHLCRYDIDDPFFEEKTKRVVAVERVSLYGLELARRKIIYSKINPVEAHEIFVREVFLQGNLLQKYPFWEHNRKLLDKVESWAIRTNASSLLEIKDNLNRFYLRETPGVSSLHELEVMWRRRSKEDPRFLFLEEGDLTGEGRVSFDKSLYPDSVVIDNVDVPLHYKYDPKGTHDGVTVTIPSALAQNIPARALDGVIPAFLQQQVYYLLKGLPKQQRMQLVPLEQRVREVAEKVPQFKLPLLDALSLILNKDYGMGVTSDHFDLSNLPNHLRPHIQLVDGDEVIAEGRDLHLLQRDDERDIAKLEGWQKAELQWEKIVTKWDFGDLPEEIVVTHVAGIPVVAHVGLKVTDDNRTTICLYKTREEAKRGSREAITLLLETELAADLHEVSKQLKKLDKERPLFGFMSVMDRYAKGALENIKRSIFQREDRFPLTEEWFNQLLTLARQRLEGMPQALMKCLHAILEAKRAALSAQKQYPGMKEDVEELVPDDFLLHVPFKQLQHLPRYLKAIVVRGERYVDSPGRDKDRRRSIEVFQERLKEGVEYEEIRWMLEEFKVSVFAQELGTAYPISQQKIERALTGNNSVDNTGERGLASRVGFEKKHL